MKFHSIFVRMKNPQYSNSVSTANGCLLGCLELFGDVCLILLVLFVGPYIGFLLLCWWVMAWILGLIFPGKELFPIKKMWAIVSDWFKRHTGHDLSGILLVSTLVLLISSLLSGLAGLFGGRK